MQEPFTNDDWQAIYNLISKYHTDKNGDEQHQILEALWKARDEYYMMIFLIPEVREYLINTWTDLDGASSAKLSSFYNSSKRGHNKKLQKQIDSGFIRVLENHEHPDRQAEILQSLSLSHRLLLNNEIYAIAASTKGYEEEVKEKYENIRVLREQLLQTIIKAVSEIALNFTARNRSPQISYADLFQEGLLGGYEATMTYNSEIERKGGRRAKWSSFAYSWVLNVMARYVAEKSRVIAIPRYVIERWNILSKAMNISGDEDFTKLCEVGNSLLSEGVEPFTEDEVELLYHTMMSNPMSIEASIEDDMTLGDCIPDPSQHTDSEVGAQEIRDQLLKSLNSLNNDEKLIVELRWGLASGEQLSLEQTAVKFREATGRRITKEKVLEIDSTARTKLKKNPALRYLWEA